VCCESAERGILAATAQNDLRLYGFQPGPAPAGADGFLTCHQRNTALVVAYADDRIRRRLDLPALADIVGAPLADVLGARVSVQSRDDLASAVASARRVALRLEEPGVHAGNTTLVLAPTLIDGVWVGALAPPAVAQPVRIEAASLHAGSPPQFASSAPADADASATASSLPLIANILDGVRSLIGVRDAAGRYLLVNTAMAEFYGVSPSAFLKRTPEQLGLPDHVLVEATARSDVEPMIARDVELTDATGHQRRFDITWRHVSSEDERARFLLEVATEIANEEELPVFRELGARRSRGAAAPPSAESDAAGVSPGDAQSRLDLVLRSGSLVLIDWNIGTDELAPSDQLAQLLDLGAQAGPTTGAEFARFAHPRDRVRVQAELHAHLNGETEDYYCEYRLKSAKGRVRWVIESGRVLARSPDGRPLNYLGTLQDVTETLETGQELQRQLARSRDAIRISDDLAREVRQLEAEIREISQREQERIGHDLHDGLGQELTGVSLLLKSLEDAILRDAPQLSARVRSVRDMVEQSIATARALAPGLSPVHLDRDGFAGALEQLAASSEVLYGIPVRFASKRHAALPPELAGAPDLYRIAQEAVRNAARHSGAEEIRLNLMVDDEKLVITVEDDGHGISPNAAAHGGMGLKIMRYRASIVGAVLDIGARDGGGTVVRCLLRHLSEGAT
jgi:PAS domain S-box-containing protein